MAVKMLKGFQCWSHLGFDGRLVMSRPKDVPYITYENGVPCYEANMYMQQKYHSSCKSGTLRTYANQIIHLIKFVKKQPSLHYFSQLTDSSFRLFVQNLQTDRDKLGRLLRSNNQVIEIAHRSLDFLMFVQDFHDLHNFIGLDKANAIQIIKKTYKIPIEGTKEKKHFEKISHICIPTKDEVKKKLPVSYDDALKVWDYIQKQKNKDKRLRDKAIYQTMEQLGGRVAELHLITMDDYNRAKNSGSNPHIQLTTLKRRDEKTTRSIPITKALLRDIAQYVKVRRRILKKKKLSHNFLFISLTTGKPFSADSWTTYLNKWKKELGIDGELHPHLYRHAFITEKLKAFILLHKEINNADDFRKHLLHTEYFKLQLQQWTGHTNVRSLDTYINLVFEDISACPKVYNAVYLKDSVTLVKRQIGTVKKQLKNKEMTVTEGLFQIEDILDAFEKDIEGCIESSNQT
ncbi:tyrosine-type recombinase/integrase [Vibrio parahaemolyticus]|nr:tyrosine-type recombinase/integrase [Vibrio parahaemolyticus]